MRGGDRLGRFELTRLLGRGGSGEVWESVLHGPQGFRKRVALKLLRPGRAEDGQRAALIREARLGALLSHPHVAATLELGEVGDRTFVAMELVDGPSAAALVRDGPLPPRAVLELGVQVAAALAHVHAPLDGAPGGLVHRDVKPQNIAIDRHGHAKLLDLGVATLAGEPEPAAGTPGYMAPEQLSGTAGPAADLFSLGATLFALAARARPFGTGVEALARIRAVETHLADPAFLAPVDAVVPGLGAVIGRCLRADPAARWSSAEALGDALRRLLQQLPPGPGLADAVRGEGASPTPASQADTIVWTGNLPPARDVFVGRDAELEAVRALLRGDDRLVTVWGPGGIGKTRLVVEAVRGTGAAWFVDLSSARDVDAVCAAVAATFGVILPDGDPVGRLGRALQARGAQVVVLDNFEQVVAAATTVGRLLDEAPRTRFVVTSRIRLDLRGERTLQLEPMDRAEGVALFVTRAPGLSAADRAEVPALVERLDGLPLAIELAAARTSVMPVSAVRARLDDRLHLLAGGARDLPERHRSLRAALDFSWDLLSGWQRAAFAQLSVFVGGCTVEAAEAVLDLSPFPDAPWALDALSSLVECSLVRYDRAADRFVLAEVVIAYAASRAGAHRAGAEARHAAWYRQLVHFGRGEDGAELAVLTAELANLSAAAVRARAAGQEAIAVDAALAASRVLRLRGPYAAGIALLDPLRDAAGPRRAELLQALGSLHRSATQLDAAEACERAALALAPPGSAVRSAAGCELALVVGMLGAPDAALALADEALVDARASGRLDAVGFALGVRANALRALGRYPEARDGYAAALETRRAAGDRRGVAQTLDNLSLLLVEDDPSAALACVDEAIAVQRGLGAVNGAAIALVHRGSILERLGRWAEAQAALEDALVQHRATGDRRFEAVTQSNLGSLLLSTGDLAAARVALEAAAAAHRALKIRQSESIATANLGRLALVEGRPADARAAFARAHALAEACGDPRWLAFAVGGLGLADEAAGALEAARARLLDAAERLGDDPAAAGFLVDLARVEHARGAPAEADRHLDRAESLVRGRPAERDTLARVLLQRRTPDARAEADALVAALQPPPGSDLGRELAHVGARPPLCAARDLDPVDVEGPG